MHSLVNSTMALCDMKRLRNTVTHLRVPTPQCWNQVFESGVHEKPDLPEAFREHWICGSGLCGTMWQGWTAQEWSNRHYG